jgi:hypothetical protein
MPAPSPTQPSPPRPNLHRVPIHHLSTAHSTLRPPSPFSTSPRQFAPHGADAQLTLEASDPLADLRRDHNFGPSSNGVVSRHKKYGFRVQLARPRLWPKSPTKTLEQFRLLQQHGIDPMLKVEQRQLNEIQGQGSPDMQEIVRILKSKETARDDCNGRPSILSMILSHRSQMPPNLLAPDSPPGSP